jgi:hypothetical protein
VAPPGSGYSTTLFYTVGSGGSELPTTTAPATDNSGSGGILNVPAGSFTVKAVLAPTGQQLATVNTLINPGVASLAYIRVRTH